MAVSLILCLAISLAASKVLPMIPMESEIATISLAQRQASFVGVLSNLPTIGPASYCTENLGDGRHIDHTKTGPSCTYNTAGPSRPVDTPVVQPAQPSGAQPIPANLGQNVDRTGGQIVDCHIYQQMTMDVNGIKHWKPVDRDFGAEECRKVCKLQSDKSDTQMPNTACMKFGEPTWIDYGNEGIAKQIAAANCLCNDPILAKVANEFVTQIVPAIAEVACKTWFTAIQLVAVTGLEAIPGVGTALAASFGVAYQAAQVAAYTFDTDEGAADGLRTWLESPAGAAMNSSTWGMDKVCGDKYTPQEGQAVFSAFSMVSGAIGPAGLWAKAARAFPPPWPKGKGSIEDMLEFMGDLGGGKKKPSGSKPGVTNTHDANPKPTGKSSEKPTDRNTSKLSSSPTAKSTPMSSASACTKNGKRAPGSGKKDDCDKPTVTVVEKSVSVTTVITKTCDFASHTQACAHYYSAWKNGGKNQLSCGDGNMRVDATATDDYYNQHNVDVWKDYIAEEYVFKKDTPTAKKGEKLRCEADEWPPAYFIPEGKLNDPEWGQRIRWIPSGENGGAGSLWRSFCSKYDGGKNNHQRNPARKMGENGKDWELSDAEYSQKPLNADLVDMKGLKPRVDDKGATVTHHYDKVTYTRAVFELAFKNPKDNEYPSKENDWYLQRNPCWPKNILPEDPGFALLTSDPWYNDHKDNKKNFGMYAGSPTQAMIDAANARGGKRPAPDSDSDDDGPRPPKAQKPNDPPSGSQRLRRRERLELIHNRVVVRDDAFNITRPLTHEEIAQDVVITDCADRFCSSDRKEYGDDGSVYVSGAAPRPSTNIAVPTLVADMVPQVLFRRTPMSANVPAITAIARMES